MGYRWELPGRLMRGWSISGTALFRSGTPFSVESGTDAPPSGNVDGVREDRPTILDPSLLGRSIDDPDTSLEILRPDLFSVEDTFINGFGNLARNTFRKDGTSNLNLAVAKEFSLSLDQTRSLTFRTEITNLTKPSTVCRAQQQRGVPVVRSNHQHAEQRSDRSVCVAVPVLIDIGVSTFLLEQTPGDRARPLSPSHWLSHGPFRSTGTRSIPDVLISWSAL